MIFTKRLREGVRKGQITCSVRIWVRPHVRVGCRYRMEEGEIEVDSILPMSLRDITPELARASGFKGVVELLKVAKHGKGENVYLVRFHYVSPSAALPARGVSGRSRGDRGRKALRSKRAGAAIMQSKVKTPKEYFDSLPENRREVMVELRKVIAKNLPKGFAEVMQYGMPGWVVPHSLYPAGYHCDPKQALPFLGIASQKQYVAVYHMGIYADPVLLKWFQDEYAKQAKGKLDMGKSCIRFKKPEQIPMKLMGELASKLTPKKWIEVYEANMKR